MFELLLRIVIPKVSTSSKSLCVANSFYLFQPDKKKKKICELCDKHARVLLPHLDKESTSWCVVALAKSTTSKDFSSIDIYHWHKQKRVCLETLEKTLLKHFPCVSTQRHAFGFDEPLSYLLALHVIAQLHTRPHEHVHLSKDTLHRLASQHTQLRQFIDDLTESMVSCRESDIQTRLREDDTLSMQHASAVRGFNIEFDT